MVNLRRTQVVNYTEFCTKRKITKELEGLEISSTFDKKNRSFLLAGNFDGEHELVDRENLPQETVLKFKGYLKDKIKSYEYLKPESIKKAILLPFFLCSKQAHSILTITLTR